LIKIRRIELLAPAKNLEAGIEAINHGADAVYIGAPKFGARAAAGNSMDDIARLAEFAHRFYAKVYVALNTILDDNELIETEELIKSLYKIGVDALIIQDMGILMLDLPPIPLHASTQADNRSVEKVKFLEKAGFSQVILARELSLEQIKEISEEVSIPLEVFIHGALCVSYSGQCYISEALVKRSANKGMCAQFCRLPYTLVDSEGKVIVENKHFLSMKDLNHSGDLEKLLDAGVTSLKIEGRLKDISYVKNTVAHYRQKLDSIFERRVEYIRSSSGKSTYTFNPDPAKSFNRGFTGYFLNGRTADIWSADSPKSIGEPIGKVKDVFDRFFVLSGTKKLNNGDGLCFFDDKRQLHGIRVNRVEGEKVFPYEQNFRIKKGTPVYRNLDHEFEKILGKKSAERRIDIFINFRETGDGFAIEAEDEDGNMSISDFTYPKEPAKTDQAENIKNNLKKTGNTIFNVTEVKTDLRKNRFIPSSLLSEWRRQATDKLLSVRLSSRPVQKVVHEHGNHAFPEKEISYLGNVMNEKSRLFYVAHQSSVKETAFEKNPLKKVPLMFTRHCIKYSLGWCPKGNNVLHNYTEPFYLVYNDKKLRLAFDCKKCEMKIYSEN